MKGFFVVWQPEHGPPRVIHETENAARAEASRLARENPGRKFFVLQATGMAVKRDVDFWELTDPLTAADIDEIPS